MMKNIADMSFGLVFYMLIGYSLSFAAGTPFIGGLSLAGIGDLPSGEYTLFFFHFSFAATTGTIVSGAVAGRMRFFTYIIVSSIFVTNFVYPAVVHWVWSSEGWLNRMGFVDFLGRDPCFEASHRRRGGVRVLLLVECNC